MRSKFESICCNLLSISIPNKVKESSHFKGRLGHNLSLVLKFELKETTLVLSRLACYPDILLKLDMKLTQPFSDASHLSIKSDVSSAKVEALISSFV